jgi:hypothetical protein
MRIRALGVSPIRTAGISPRAILARTVSSCWPSSFAASLTVKRVCGCSLTFTTLSGYSRHRLAHVCGGLFNLPDELRASNANGNHRGAGYDPMINGTWRATEVLPRRIVVELEPADFEKFNKACGRIPPADFLRLVALRITET